MIPVDQQCLHDPARGVFGDCMRACIASLLELPASMVPHFTEMDENSTNHNWINNTQEFLKLYGFMFIEVEDIRWCWRSRCLGAPLFMAGGKSPRGDFGHWVIGEMTRDGFKMVHDPHPSRDGLNGKPENYGLLVGLFYQDSMEQMHGI